MYFRMPGIRVCTERETPKMGTTIHEMHFSWRRNWWDVRIPALGSGTTTACMDQRRSFQRRYDLHRQSTAQIRKTSHLWLDASESRGSMDNMSRTTLEDYKEVMTLDANLPVTSTILASRGWTLTRGIEEREKNEADTDCSATSGRMNIDLLTETAEASETSTAPRCSGRVQQVPVFFFPGRNYVNYTNAGEPCTLNEACRAPDVMLWQTTMANIYMSQPEGFMEIGADHLVCCLKKSLYSLKQASRMW